MKLLKAIVETLVLLALVGAVVWSGYTHLDAKITESRQHTRTQIDQLEQRMSQRMDRLDQRITQRMDRLDAKIDRLAEALYRSGLPRPPTDAALPSLPPSHEVAIP